MNTLAAILSSRRDNWKDDKRFLTSILSFIEEFDEVWYIDWNSPEYSLLENIRQYLPSTKKFHHVVVSANLVKDLMSLYPNAEVCNTDIARNIGIRRASSNWIVATNVDIIAPSRKLLLKQLKDKNTFYTISRREAPQFIYQSFSAQQWKKLKGELNKYIIPRYYLDGISPNDHYSIINSCGDFQVAHRDIWYNIRGFEENMVYSLFQDSNVQKKAVMHGFMLKALFEPPIYHIEHANYCDPLANTIKKQIKYNDPLIWMEHFEKTFNSRNWGLTDIDLPVEII